MNITTPGTDGLKTHYRSSQQGSSRRKNKVSAEEAEERAVELIKGLRGYKITSGRTNWWIIRRGFNPRAILSLHV